MIGTIDHLKKPLGRNWREQAACGTADPKLFEERPLTGPRRRAPQDIIETAHKYCRRCPVLAECKKEADENHALRGLLGGVYRTVNLNTRTGAKARRTFDLLAIPAQEPKQRK
jgi:hypothetical protein